MQKDRENARSFELAGPAGRGDVGEYEKEGRTAPRVAGNDVSVIDFSLLTAMDEASRHLLSRRHAGETRILAICEQAGQLAESIGGIPAPSVPAAFEPFGIWISLGASQKQ